MEEWVKIIAPMVAPLVAIAALWWKITTSVATKEDVNRIAENLQKQPNHWFYLMIDLHRYIRKDMRQMRSEMQGHAEKIDASSQTLHTKINSVANEFRAEIRERIRGVDS
jgi:hypothetical protein